MNARHRFTCAAALAALLAACSGGANAPVAPNPGSSPAGAHSSGNVVATIKIPASGTTNARRKPAYLTAAVQGIQFSVTSTAILYSASNFFPLTISSGNCTGTPLTCTVSFGAPAGTDTITVTTFDGTNPYTNPVSTVTLTNQTVSPGVNNTFNFVTQGVAANIVLGVANPFPAATGSSSPQTLLYVVTDADNYVIVGPFANPIALTDADSTNATSLSTSVITAPGMPIALNWNGTAMNTPAQIQAGIVPSNAGGNATAVETEFQGGANGIVAFPSYLAFASSTASAQTLSVGGPGTTAPYNVSATAPPSWSGYNSCAGMVTVSGSSPLFSVAPVSGKTGTCALDVFDGSATPYTFSVPVTISPP